jgi:hypothetical protein
MKAIGELLPLERNEEALTHSRNGAKEEQGGRKAIHCHLSRS